MNELLLEIPGVSQLASKISLIRPEMAVFFFFDKICQKNGKGRFTISPFLLENVVYFEISTGKSHFFPKLRCFCVFSGASFS